MYPTEVEDHSLTIQLGPFIDASHPIIASGAITRSPADIFKSEITARLLRTGEVSPNTYILLVPSVKDIVSTHMAYPQAMLDKETLGLPKVFLGALQ
jgi:DNA polymerase alpha subunit B